MKTRASNLIFTLTDALLGQGMMKFEYDEKGQFRWETYFVRGKQKRMKIRTVEGLDVDEFIRRNADDIWLMQEGYYEILHERYTSSTPEVVPENSRRQDDDAKGIGDTEDDDDEIPF